MLQNSWPSKDFSPVVGRSVNDLGPAVDFGIIRRRWKLFLLVLTVSLATALTYLLLRTPSFTAAGRIIVDSRVLHMSQHNTVFTSSAAATGWAAPHVLSQVEILRSQRVRSKAIGLLDAQGQPLGIWESHGLNRMYDAVHGTAVAYVAAPLLVALGAQTPVQRLQAEDRLVESLRRRISVARLGETFAIEVRGTSQNASEAARIVNAVITAYLGEIAAANAEASKAASAWLREAAREAGASARVISDATPPVRPDGPSGIQVLLTALLGGVLGGFVIALGRDILDRRIQSTQQAAALLAAECFGRLPIIERAKLKGRAPTCPSDRRSEFDPIVIFNHENLDVAIRWPNSRYAHIIDKVRIAATMERRNLRTLGVTSIHAGSGTSTVACNLALASAASGNRTILIDCTRNGGLTLLGDHSAVGSRQLDSTGLFAIALPTMFLRHPITGLDFVPQTLPTGRLDLSRLPDMIGTHHELVILDLPPLTPTSDVRSATQFVDAFLLVIEPGRSTSDDVASAVAGSGSFRHQLLGTVLNKCEPREKYPLVSEAE